MWGNSRQGKSGVMVGKGDVGQQLAREMWGNGGQGRCGATVGKEKVG